jgi:hypothetical protein
MIMTLMTTVALPMNPDEKIKKRGMKREVVLKLFHLARENSDSEAMLVFDNHQVKKVCQSVGFQNQYDVVKHNSPSSLPMEVAEKGYFIVHLGRKGREAARHAFVCDSSRTFNGFHSFEKIPEGRRKKWSYDKNLLSAVSEAEAQTISTLYHAGAIKNFLIGNQKRPIMMHLGRRAKVNLEGEICPGVQFPGGSIQLEIDAFIECPRTKNKPAILAAVEAKTTTAECFEVRQIYTSMKYMHSRIEEKLIPSQTEIHCIFVVQKRAMIKSLEGQHTVRVYDYCFVDPNVMSSIKLQKSRMYKMTAAN